jgi:hypothetical protein
MDRTLILAQGKALALVAALLQRGGIVEAAEFGDMLGVFSVTVAETDPEEGDVLAIWAAIIRDSARA